MLRRALYCLTVIVIAGSSASCDKVVSGKDPAAACGWVTAPSEAESSPVSSDTAVLVDNTASFWPKAGERPSLPGDPVSGAVNALLRNFGSSGTRLVSFGTFDGSSATIDWKSSRAALPQPTGDSGEIQAERHNAETCLTSVVKAALAVAPQAPRTDVMAALAAAGQQLQGAPAAADQVVLITDGLSNTGCLSLSDVIRHGKSASAVLGSCPERDDLTSLRGVSLRLIGIGYQAAQPPLTTSEQAWVDGYWRQMCAALRVASSASCEAPAGTGAPRSSAAAHLADPAIVFPSVHKNDRVVPVPADLLFEFDSAALSEAGQAYLRILGQQLKAQGRTVTRVVGHTDAVGTSAYNLGLSRRRADAVGGYLAQLGFSGMTTVGAGEADPACSPQYTATGAPIRPCMARDRRVQIFLGG